MVIPIQYNETLKVTRLLGSSQDENGNWIDGGKLEFTIKAGLRTNSKGSVVRGEDGNNINYAYDVRIPISERNLEIDDTVEWNGFEFKVLNYQKGQLHARAWL